MKKNQFAPQTTFLVKLKGNKKNVDFNLFIFFIKELSFNINASIIVLHRIKIKYTVRPKN